jgi:outer membrane protein TolC
MKKLVILATICFIWTGLRAQVSMMEDVSQPYLDKLIEIGKANYPKFKYTTAKTAASKAAYDKAKWGVFDFATLGYVYSPNMYNVYDQRGTYNSSLNGYQVGLFLNVGSVLQKPSIIKGAKQEYIATQMDKEVIDLDVVQEIRKRYYTYIQQKNVLRLKSKAVADVDDMLKHVKYKFEKGEVTFDSYNQVLISVSSYSQEKINAEAAMLIAKSSLEQLLGTSLESIKVN